MSQLRNTVGQLLRRPYTTPVALAFAGLAACSAERVSGPAVAAPSAAAAAYASGPAEQDAGKRTTDAGLTALAATWRTSAGDVLAPTTVPLDLTCGFRGVYVVSQRVGRGGGSLKFGQSELKIPSGALAADVTISATITIGAGVDVDFAPHGLKFAKAAELKVNYAGCTGPSGYPVNTYYTNDAGYVTQVMPSNGKAGATEVRMLTDHFSGFTVGWGRAGK